MSSKDCCNLKHCSNIDFIIFLFLSCKVFYFLKDQPTLLDFFSPNATSVRKRKRKVENCIPTLASPSFVHVVNLNDTNENFDDEYFDVTDYNTINKHDRFEKRHSESSALGDRNSVGDMWNCTMCTFANSHLLPYCEVCNSPKIGNKQLCLPEPDNLNRMTRKNSLLNGSSKFQEILSTSCKKEILNEEHSCDMQSFIEKNEYNKETCNKKNVSHNLIEQDIVSCNHSNVNVSAPCIGKNSQLHN